MTTLSTPTIATFAAHRFSQASHVKKHVICFRAPKPENQALARIRPCVGRRKRPQPKTVLGGARRDLPVRQTRRKRDYQMHSGLRTKNFHIATVDLGAELLPQRLR